MSRVIVIVAACALISAVNAAFGDELNNIDELMSARLALIEQALAEFDQTKAPGKMAEIERLNEDAGDALVDWWHHASALCCTVGKVEDPKAAFKENEAKLNKYLDSLCNNSLNIAGRYAEIKNRKKARSIYQYVTKSFDPSTSGECVGQAELKLRGMR